MAWGDGKSKVIAGLIPDLSGHLGCDLALTAV
jgi:hypothetical protein